MNAFPLFKLPLLVQREIFGLCDPFTLIEISLVSKKCKKDLQEVDIEIERLEYTFDNGHSIFTIHNSSGTLSIQPQFYFNEFKTNEFWNIDGKDLIRTSKMSIPSDRLILVGSKEYSDKSKIEVLEKLTVYLLGFLKVKKFGINVRGNIDVSNLFIWKCTKHFDRIMINPHCFKPADLTSDMLELILERLTTDFLSLNVKIRKDPNFKYHPKNKGSSKIRKIEIKNSSWVDYDYLLNMANESISCRIQNGLSEKANEIIKEWMSGTNETLEVLTLLADGGKQFDKIKVLYGTNAIPSLVTKDELKKLKSSGSSIVLPAIHTAMDIRRVHDGCQATLLIAYGCIDMCVWNEKNLKAIGRM